MKNNVSWTIHRTVMQSLDKQLPAFSMWKYEVQQIVSDRQPFASAVHFKLQEMIDGE